MTASKFHEATCKIIIGAVRKNLTHQLAADYARVDVRSLQKWIAEGKADSENGLDTEKGRFYHDLKKAKADAADEMLQIISQAAREPKQWTAGAWLLERVHRQDYSQQGDAFEKIEEKINALNERLDKREQKSLGAKANDSKEVDTESAS